METEKLTISVPEAARRLGMSKSAVYQLARRKDFPAFSVGGRTLVSVSGLVAWVEAQATKGSEANGE